MLGQDFLDEAIKKFITSPQGRKQIKEKIGLNYVPSGTGSGGVGTVAQADVLALAEKAKRILYGHIISQVPGIMLHNIKVSRPIIGKDGMTTVTLSLVDVERESLQPNRYWRGVEDIVLHFARGWNAKYQLRGNWHGQNVGSRQWRDSHPFMQRAIKAINTELGEAAEATLLDDYARL